MRAGKSIKQQECMQRQGSSDDKNSCDDGDALRESLHRMRRDIQASLLARQAMSKSMQESETCLEKLRQTIRKRRLVAVAGHSSNSKQQLQEHDGRDEQTSGEDSPAVMNTNIPSSPSLDVVLLQKHEVELDLQCVKVQLERKSDELNGLKSNTEQLMESLASKSSSQATAERAGGKVAVVP